MSGGDTRTLLQVLTPGWRQLRDLWPPPPQNRSVTFREVEPPLWCQADWEAGLGGWGEGLSGLCQRGRRSQPERQTPAKVTQKVATVQRSRKSWLCGGGAWEENGGARAPPAQGSALRIKAALS